MNNKKFKISDRLRSFRFAFNGIKVLFVYGHNAWIHLSAACLVIIAGFIFNISRLDWIAIIFAIGFVLALEAVNSSVEKLADFISPQKQDQIKIAKDLAAAGVLISAISALIIGLIVFIPRIIDLIQL
jgi:diacylglycerol kinase (ATP)